MAKSNKKRKKERRAEEKAELEAAREAAERRQRRYRRILVALPLATLAAAAATYFGFDDVRAAALVGVIGVALWVPILLGALGGSVRPRDRDRAGSIDFGQRR